MPFRRSTILGVTAATIAVFAAAGTARAAYKTVTVKENGQSEKVSEFTFGSVGSLLKSKNIKFNDTDRIYPSLTSSLSDGETVTIECPTSIQMNDGGKMVHLLTFSRTVKDLLKERQITLGPYDRVNQKLSNHLVSGGTVLIQRIRKEVSTKTQVIPFQTIHQPSDGLYIGESRVLTNGVNGLMRDRFVTVFVNNHKTSTTVQTHTVRKPVNQVVAYGTKARPLQQDSLGARSYNLANFTSITVSATAYVEGGRTATGCLALPGVIAVDPSVIPLGTRLYIPGIGIVRAADRGSSIIGNRIDICMASLEEADAWGRRTITIYVLK